jgi:hypothetical protein
MGLAKNGLVGTKFPLTHIVFGALWLLAVGVGFNLVLKYQTANGSAGVAPQDWPKGSRLRMDSTHDTLIMFAHPQCPCTRASIEELNRLLARTQGKVSTQVLFFKPAQFPDSWAKADLWRSAAAIPGVAVEADSEGAEARLFGAQTSGYVLLYDTRGRLLFKGGITGSRGHAGDNDGENAILALVTGQEANLKQTQVFGCSLLDRCEAPATKTLK